MARRYDIEFTKTYATEANAERAIQKAIGINHEDATHWTSNLRYSILPVVQDDKIRYGIVFYGERAIQAQMHFRFNVIV